MPTTELAGLSILVTRPGHQAEPLCRLIEAAGGRALRLPLLEIHGCSDSPELGRTLAHLGDYHLLIFVSPNAVRHGAHAIALHGGLPASARIAAVGSGSARAIREYLGRGPDLVPQQFDSEGLLALDELQQMSGKRVLIFRGNGGRELLADTLCGRGAQVDYAEVYRRDCPPPLADGDERLAKADIILLTSSEGLANLLAMAPASARARLLATPLLLISERTAAEARRLGFQGDAVVSPQASDEAIVETLIGWARARP